jgi:uncharacterized protein involved in cysteine biosynthesis
VLVAAPHGIAEQSRRCGCWALPSFKTCWPSLYVLMAGMNFFVFPGPNGYLSRREYFAVVALRRLELTAVGAARTRFAGRVFLTSAAIAELFAVPFVNPVAPAVATAFTVHRVAGLRCTQAQLLST